MKKILLLEDDKKIARALGIRLQAAGYDVLTESNGRYGIKAALSYQPDLIISDIWMPGKAGFLVAEELKRLGLDQIPVIFMTASRKPKLWRTSQEMGAAAFFEKPYDPVKLLAAVERALTNAPTSTDALEPDQQAAA